MSLDPSDGEVRIFLKHVMAAIQALFPKPDKPGLKIEDLEKLQFFIDASISYR